MFHFVKRFGIINKTEVQVMLYFNSSLGPEANISLIGATSGGKGY